MSVLDRKVFRDLIRSAVMLLAVVCIMALGISCFVSMTTTYNNLEEARRRYYRQCRMADFWVDLKKVPLTEIERVARIPGIAAVRSRIGFYVVVDVPGIEQPLNGLVLSLPDAQQAVINDIVLRSGTYFTGSRANEVIVCDAFARAHGLKPGDRIRLILNNRLESVVIVGTAISSEFVYLLQPGSMAPNPEQFGVFYIKRSFAEDVFDFSGAANQVVGILTPEYRDNPKPILVRLERVLEPYGVFSAIGLGDQMSNKFLSQELLGLRVFAFILPTIFLAVAAMVLNVFMRRVAEQQRLVIGTLKALGYSDFQVMLHFFKQAAAVGLIGSLGGCALGYWMAGGLTRLYSKFYEFPELVNRFYPEWMLAAVGLSLGCAALGAWQGMRAIVRLQPAEAMRPKPPRFGGPVLLERFAFLWQQLSPDWRLAMRNLFRSPLRTFSGFMASAIGAMLLSNGLIGADCSRFLLDFQFHWINRSHFDVWFQNEEDVSVVDDLRKLPGVLAVEPVLSVPCTIRNGAYQRRGAVLGVTPDAQLTVPRTRNAEPIPIPPTGLVVNRKLAEVLHVSVGDWLELRPIKGLRKPIAAPVVKLCDSFFGMDVYADLRYLSRLVGEKLCVSGVQILTDGSQASRSSLYARLKQMAGLKSLTDRQQTVENLEKLFIEAMDIFIKVLIGFAAAVFLGSIINNSLISLSERQRELATLVVMGYSNWQIGMLLFRENMIVSLLGAIAGLPLGYLLSLVTSWAYNTELFRFPVVVEPDSFYLTILAAVAFTVIAHVLVQLHVSRSKWLEALQVKE